MTRVVVSGASGNIGSALLPLLRSAGLRPVALARRPPREPDGVEWVRADLSTPDGQRALARALRGPDAYVHLAWPLQPMRRPGLLRDRGPRMLLPCVLAALEAGVDRVVHLSSVAAYAPGAGPVDESWPLGGVADSPYAQDKALGERRLEHMLQAGGVGDRVAVLRPCLVGQRRAGGQMARYGMPAALAGARVVGHVPCVPVVRDLALQMVQADDVARAVLAVSERRASGAFNLAGDGLAPAPGAARSHVGRHGRGRAAHGHRARAPGPGLATGAPGRRRPPRGRRGDGERCRWRGRRPSSRRAVVGAARLAGARDRGPPHPPLTLSRWGAARSSCAPRG